MKGKKIGEGPQTNKNMLGVAKGHKHPHPPKPTPGPNPSPITPITPPSTDYSKFPRIVFESDSLEFFFHIWQFLWPNYPNTPQAAPAEPFASCPSAWHFVGSNTQGSGMLTIYCEDPAFLQQVALFIAQEDMKAGDTSKGFTIQFMPAMLAA